MKRIKLSQNKYALIDNCDFEKVSKFKWCYEKFSGNEYAMRKDSKGKNIRMHRFIMNFPDGIVDHKNRNGLDNRRKNLRATTKSINALNTKKYKRYYFDKNRNVYRSKIKVGNKSHYLGSFKTEREIKKAVSIFINKTLKEKQ